MLADFTIVDLKTTGLDPHAGRIVELAARRYRGGKPTWAATYLIDAGVEPEPAAVALHGLTADYLAAHGKPERAALGSFFSAVCDGGTVLVAHNAAFEMSWLHQARLRLFGLPFEQPFLCTKTLSVELRAGSGISYSLRQLCADYSIDWVGPAHRAMPDVQATKALLDVLMQHEVGLLAAGELLNCCGVAAGQHHHLPAGLPAHAKEVRQ